MSTRAIVLGLCLILFSGFISCTKEEWVGEEKVYSYRAEITNMPEKEGIHFKKKNDFPWTNVVFTVNKEYIFSSTEIRPGQCEFILYYSDFEHKDTGEKYNPVKHGELFRIWIEGDEGIWY
jgi:hypothetical protein